MCPRLRVWLCLVAILGSLACQPGTEDAAQQSAEDVVLVLAGQETSFSATRTILVATDAAGTVRCDGEVVDDLPAAVAARARGTDGPLAILDLAPETPCDHVETILALIRKGGVTRVAFAHDLERDRTAFPLVLPEYEASPLAIEPSQAIVLAVGSGGEIRLGDEVVGEAELTARVRARLAEDDTRIVCVEPEATVTYGQLFSMLRALGEAKAARISLWGDNAGVSIASASES